MSNPIRNDEDEESHTLIQQTTTENDSILKSIIYLCNFPIFWYAGALWLFLVLVSGAGYILALLGACTMTTTQCHSFININNAILTGLFTAINLYAFPGRFSRMLGLCMFGEQGIDYTGSSVPNNKSKKTLLAESYDPSTFHHFSLL
mmetsp:Transcript_460/g.592  ORF Transcript_460/g.592 Transcript_460/m.592 type:complete len:147 (-) Transcript_460:187-627(-)